MAQPVSWDGTVSRGTWKASWATETEADAFDFLWRIFVSPPQSKVIDRLGTFVLNDPIPAETTDYELTLSSSIYVGDGAITVTSSIPATYPDKGEAFIWYNDEYRRFQWTGKTATSFTGISWRGEPGGRFYFPANVSKVNLWVEVSDRIGGENAIRMQATRNGYVASWVGAVRGEGFNGSLFGKDNYILLARALSTDPIAGTWETSGGNIVYRLNKMGFIRSLPEHVIDQSGRNIFSVRIAGLMDIARNTYADPISVGNRDVAAGITPEVSSTLLDIENFQNIKGDWVGTTPSADPANMTDGNAYTFWMSEGVPYETYQDPTTGQMQLIIDEVFCNPHVGRNEDYKFIVLFNPNLGDTKNSHEFNIVVSDPALEWAEWVNADPQDPGDSGHLGPYKPASDPSVDAWLDYPSISYQLPFGYEIPPQSKAIICRDATKFTEMFDPGDAQIIEMPGLPIPTSDAIIKILWSVSGGGAGVNPGDTIVYGSPTYTLPSYWNAPNCPNPDPGFTVRRRKTGDLTVNNGHSGDNFVLDANPTPGDLRDKEQREWAKIDFGSDSIGLRLENSIGTGALTEITFTDAGGDPASTYKLDKSGSIKFDGKTEVIQYSDNDGRRLTGITRGGTPEAVTANTAVNQMVDAQATKDIACNAIRLSARPSGPVIGRVEIYGSKIGSGTANTPPTDVEKLDDFPGPSEYYTAVNQWRNDWDILWHGDVNSHDRTIPFPVRRSRMYMVVIYSMPVQATLVHPATNVLSGDIVVRTVTAHPGNELAGLGTYMKHAGIHYTFGSVIQNQDGTYTLVNVQARPGQDLGSFSPGDNHIYVGNNRARLSNLEIHQANLIGEDGLMIGEGDTSVLFKYLLNESLGLMNSRVVHINQPQMVGSLVTTKSSIVGLLNDICRRRGLVVIEWGDMTVEVFGDPFRPVRNGYTESIYSFSESNSVRLNRVDTAPEDVSQVEVTVNDPSTGRTQSARYPVRPYLRGRLHREGDLVGDAGMGNAFSLAAAIFRRMRNGKTTTVVPSGPADWAYPIMRVDVLEDDENMQVSRLVPHTIESVSHSWSFGRTKSYTCEIITRPL